VALRKKETVRWALAAPQRLRGLVKEGKLNEAQKDWAVVKALLDKWGEGVNGVRALKEEGERALRGE